MYMILHITDSVVVVEVVKSITTITNIMDCLNQSEEKLYEVKCYK